MSTFQQHSVSWFEIPSQDFDRAHQFYSRVVGQMLPIQEADGTQMALLPHEPTSGVGGAVVHSADARPTQDGTRVYLNAHDEMNTWLERVIPAGGSVVVNKTKIASEGGYWAVIADTEGNHVGVFGRS
ncbi:MAG: VOC family protein [Catalinimonas sp.]